MIWILSIAILMRAADVNSASCSRVDVGNAYTAANQGDRILIPSCPGGATWDNTLTVSKAVTIEGAGIGQTIINHGFSSGGLFNVTQHSTVNQIIKGIEMRGLTWPKKGVVVTGSPGDAEFRITACRFYASGGDAAAIYVHGGGNKGLIDNNYFESDASPNEFIHNEAYGFGSTAGWTNDVSPGGPNMIFIEDNDFRFNTSGSFFGASAVQSYYGARTVFRHNVCHMCQIDTHGTSGNIGGRWTEVYANEFNTDAAAPNQSDYIVFRGGSGVVYDNIHTGNANLGAGAIRFYEEDSGYPSNYQPGRGINNTLSPIYVWNNGGDMTVAVDGSMVQLNRDVFVSGSQPALMLRQQLSGDNGSTTYSYTAYTYPHPLQGGGGGSTRSSATGGGLRLSGGVRIQ